MQSNNPVLSRPDAWQPDTPSQHPQYPGQVPGQGPSVSTSQHRFSVVRGLTNVGTRRQ